MQLSSNSTGAYKRNLGRRNKYQNRGDQPFLLLPNLSKRFKVSKSSLTSALIMAIKIGAFIGVFALIFSIVRGQQPTGTAGGTPIGQEPPPTTTQTPPTLGLGGGGASAGGSSAPLGDPQMLACIQALVKIIQILSAQTQGAPSPSHQIPPPECLACGEKCNPSPPSEMPPTTTQSPLIGAGSGSSGAGSGAGATGAGATGAGTGGAGAGAGGAGGAGATGAGATGTGTGGAGAGGSTGAGAGSTGAGTGGTP